MTRRSAKSCPCGSGAAYRDCCGALHQGRVATTAEQLMRSRYSAFVRMDQHYLLRTWAARTRPPGVEFDRTVEWTGLEILGSTEGSAFHSEGTVEFRARFEVNGQAGEQQENSRFVREDGLWVYLGPER